MTENNPRLEAAREAFRKHKIDALVLTGLPNVRYLSGFTGDNAALLVTGADATLFTDPRFTIQASRESVCRLKVSRKPLLSDLAALAKRKRLRRIGFEAARIGYDAFERLRSELPPGVTLLPVRGLVERLRLVKSAEEIEKIRLSMQIGSQAYEQALETVQEGMTEAELASEIDYRMRRLGAQAPAFETIVAFGERSAIPHASPGESRLAPGDLILVDMGACRQGYMSDMTRVAAFRHASRRLARMHRAVLEAQAAAAAVVRAGIPAAMPDREARRVLRGYKLEAAFVHSTGHGLGLEIHEPPRLGKKEKAVLEAGMTVTIEPGVYLEGVGGVRIEDTVVVAKNGFVSLTTNPKELRVL